MCAIRMMWTNSKYIIIDVVKTCKIRVHYSNANENEKGVAGKKVSKKYESHVEMCETFVCVYVFYS